MNNIIISSSTFAVFISIFSYSIGKYLKDKYKFNLINPLIISIVLVIIFLLIFKIDYSDYSKNTQFISFLLTPATVSLAIPLYMQLDLLKKNILAIILSILSGVITSLVCIFIFSKLFNFSHEQYVTILPKSITTAIGLSISKELGGQTSITVAIIIMTGIFGNIIAESICKIFKITNKIAIGIAIGTSSHAVGTSKAIEIGEIEGAMSSLSIVITGILTLIGVNIFVNFI